MVFNSGESMSESGNWNRADDWSREMIFRPLLECTMYLSISVFGCSNMEEEAFFDDKTKEKWKIKGLHWARERLDTAISNAIFAIKSKVDQDLVRKYLKEVQDIEELLPGIEERYTDREVVTIKINEEKHKIVYKLLKKILREITEPFNRSDLIFIFKEPFDSEQFKEDAMKRFVDGD